MRKKIESHLEARLGFPVETMLRTLDELRAMMERDPFRGLVEDAEKKLYVSILHDLPVAKLYLPYIDEKEGIEVIEITGEDAFIISRKIANGHFGFPNIVIEKKLKVAATTRNWNTLKKLVQ
jgi:uncharacterized protein (DUF1697 family)